MVEIGKDHARLPCPPVEIEASEVASSQSELTVLDCGGSLPFDRTRPAKSLVKQLASRPLIGCTGLVDPWSLDKLTPPAHPIIMISRAEYSPLGQGDKDTLPGAPPGMNHPKNGCDWSRGRLAQDQKLTKLID
ncbi:hypothetical protein RRG08_053403 [Elysia crispata]|uniref:Uncharacterized protein n=1 Tax=Elysia crispata TaxID=231223 RepID=A0AAE0ZFK5_9GAST|nr:hypothetical protein RRG08_053403 [Elysia crispata]